MKNNNHDYVDLGLPSGTLWATCNVGANAPEEYGDYFAWGETKPKDNYDLDTYKFTTDGGTTFTKYNGTDGKTTLDPEDDAVAVNWGGKWRMPTDDEWTELRNECTWTWVEGYNGTDKNGYEVKSNANGNSIFLPAAGFRYRGNLNYAGSYGYYWSSSLDTGRPFDAWYVYLYSGGVGRDYGRRCYGISVRPVQNKKVMKTSMTTEIKNRLQKEHDELLQRLGKLSKLINADNFQTRTDISFEEKVLLKLQYTYMDMYWSVLHERMGMHNLFKQG